MMFLFHSAIPLFVEGLMWQSTWGKWWLTHWASLLRWIWSISEYNLWLGTPQNGPCVDHVLGNVEGADLQNKSQSTPECLARANLIGWDPMGIPRRSMKMWSGIVHHKSDRKTCVLPTADRNSMTAVQCQIPAAAGGGPGTVWFLIKRNNVKSSYLAPKRSL